MLEMAGPLIFAAVMVLGYQAGIRTLAICFALMAVAFVVLDAFNGKNGSKGKGSEA